VATLSPINGTGRWENLKRRKKMRVNKEKLLKAVLDKKTEVIKHTFRLDDIEFSNRDFCATIDGIDFRLFENEFTFKTVTYIPIEEIDKAKNACEELIKELKRLDVIKREG
jgi:hypothetical protein